MTLHALLFERPKMSGALAVVACLALVKLAALLAGDAGPDRLAPDDTQVAIAAGLGAALWLGLRDQVARRRRASGDTTIRARPGGLVAVVFVLALAGLPIGIAQVVHRATLPAAARVSSIEARFAPEIERLTALTRARHVAAGAEKLNASELSRAAKGDPLLVASPTLLGATIWSGGEKSAARSGELVFGDTHRMHKPGWSWFPRRPDAPGESVANITEGEGHRTIAYSRVVAKRGPQVFGFTLVLDLDALERTAPK